MPLYSYLYRHGTHEIRDDIVDGESVSEADAERVHAQVDANETQSNETSAQPLIPPIPVRIFPMPASLCAPSPSGPTSSSATTTTCGYVEQRFALDSSHPHPPSLLALSTYAPAESHSTSASHEAKQQHWRLT